MSHALARLGGYAARNPWKTIGAWVLAALVIVAASSAVGRELEDTASAPGLDSQKAVDLLSEVESDRAGLTAQVVITPGDTDATFDSPSAQAGMDAVQATLAELPDVLGTSEAVALDGRTALVRLQYPVMEELSSGNLSDLETALDDLRETTPFDMEAGGDLYVAFGDTETGTGEIIGLLAAVVILLVAFGSVIAMGLPIGMALFGLGIGISAMSLLAYLVEMPTEAPTMASMVGLGVGIDYALLLVSRHRENLAAGMDVPDAASRAVATAGQAVVFAGGTVVVAILGLAVAGIPFLTAAAVGISTVVLIMVLASISLLPAFLGLAGRRVNGRAARRRALEHPTATGVSARWQRWGAHVADHAWPYAIGVTAVLLLLTAPVLSLRLGFPDEGTLPESRTERRAYDLVADGFGPGVNGPLVVAVDTAGDPQVVDELAAAIDADPGIASVAPPEVDPTSGVATIAAIPATSPQDAATFETITRLRSQVFTDVLADSPARAHVGGQTAGFADLGERVAQRLPLFIAVVVGLSFLLLMLVFRSVLVPLKAAILNLLSIGAAYGVLVLVFQWGWGADLIGLESTVPVVSFIPMLMFAVLFGLSMDYEVFLLSRVREEYLATGDNHASVVRGLAGTARVITSAALIMVSVFGGFVLGDNPTIKMLGLGLAVAILIDATVVRMVLVPASMTLMGDANWWLPRWLDRRLPTIDLEGSDQDTPPDPEPRGEDADRDRTLVGTT